MRARRWSPVRRTRSPAPTRWSPSHRSTASRSLSRRRSAAAVAGSRWPGPSRRSRSCSRPRSARRSPRSAGASASSSATWTSPATSRLRCSPTRTATSSSSVRGTARCNGGTRSWSRRRPAPFLTDAQRSQIHDVREGDLQGGRLSRRRHRGIPRRPGRHRLVPRGQHPAAGRAPGDRGDRGLSTWCASSSGSPTASRCASTEDPTPRGHAIEFRINGEDPGRGFLPAPGVVTELRLPSGPGVRVDTGIESGSVIGGNFDSLLAKVIVVGATREQAIERSRRVLDEMIVDGMATALPFHRLIVRDRGLHVRAVHRAHPVDRDRVGRRRTAVRPRRGARRRPGRAGDGGGRGRRQADRGLAAGRLDGGGTSRRGRGRRRTEARQEGPAALGRERRLADLADAGHDRQDRGARTATRWPRAT